MSYAEGTLKIYSDENRTSLLNKYGSTEIEEAAMTYNGEKEILDINDKINKKLFMLPQHNKHITAMKQQNCLILDDKETGVVRKHGVLIYEFLLTSALGEVKE